MVGRTSRSQRRLTLGSRLGSLRREFWRRLKNLSVRTLEPIVEATLVGTTCRLRSFANVR